jgi:hypothetical protein
MRLASSRVSSFAADRRPGSSSKQKEASAWPPPVSLTIGVAPQFFPRLYDALCRAPLASPVRFPDRARADHKPHQRASCGYGCG